MFKSRINTNFGAYVILTFGALVMIVPFAWMLLTAFKTQAEAISVNPFLFFPKELNFTSYLDAFAHNDFFRLYFVTLGAMFLRVVFALFFSSLAAYAFARLNFPGKSLLFFIVLFQMMVPPQIFIIPQYLMIDTLSMRNTIFALVFPGLVSAFGTFLLRQFFAILPKDLEDAAIIDGCSIPKTFFLVMLPLAKSGLLALGIFTALFAFKDLMWPMIINPDQNMTTLSAALARQSNAGIVNYPELMATAVIAVTPMIIIYLIFQRQFTAGIATSGSKL